jgi:hypothetical protein
MLIEENDFIMYATICISASAHCNSLRQSTCRINTSSRINDLLVFRSFILSGIFDERTRMRIKHKYYVRYVSRTRYALQQAVKLLSWDVLCLAPFNFVWRRHELD